MECRKALPDSSLPSLLAALGAYAVRCRAHRRASGDAPGERGHAWHRRPFQVARAGQSGHDPCLGLYRPLRAQRPKLEHQHRMGRLSRDRGDLRADRPTTRADRRTCSHWPDSLADPCKRRRTGDGWGLAISSPAMSVRLRARRNCLRTDAALPSARLARRVAGPTDRHRGDRRTTPCPRQRATPVRSSPRPTIPPSARRKIRAAAAGSCGPSRRPPRRSASPESPAGWSPR